MADIKWIKIDTNIFDDEKIQLIEELPGADTVIMIWFKLLVLAGKKNDSGLIYITKDIPYDAAKLARVMRREVSIVKLALDTFIKFGMIYIENDIIAVTNWEKHQNIDGLDKLKEQWRIASKTYRDKQKNAIEDKSHMKSYDGHTTDKNINRKDKEKKDIYSPLRAEVIAFLNYCLLKEKGFDYNSAIAKKHMDARFKEGATVDDMKEVIVVKCSHWICDDKFKMYLRPDTLFGTKFEVYRTEERKQIQYEEYGQKKYMDVAEFLNLEDFKWEVNS